MTTQTVEKNLATVEDLDCGNSTTSQTRAGTAYTLHQMMVPACVTTEAAMQALDETKIPFCRIFVGTQNYYDYVFDSAALAGIAPDSGAAGYWVELQPMRFTTAQIEDISNGINTDHKFEGTQIFNSTTNKPLWAAGNTAGDVWVDATGATAHTPV